MESGITNHMEPGMEVLFRVADPYRENNHESEELKCFEVCVALPEIVDVVLAIAEIRERQRRCNEARPRWTRRGHHRKAFRLGPSRLSIGGKHN
jgi:hypothetical protein